ncbi:MAG: hypothetical protein FJZ87_04930 [Chloroflexi bacterium]|nr:hypothetical protein [Chloroflexota bacterium]
MTEHMREKILDLLAGKEIDTQPAFSGLIHITLEGLKQEGLSLHEVHHNSQKMAGAATSTFRTTGMPSAALPLDLCAPAEALGAKLNYPEPGDDQFPQVHRPWAQSVKEIEFDDIQTLKQGRIPLICEAIGLVKHDVGSEIVISGMLPGPYTLLLYLCDPVSLFMEMKKDPSAVTVALMRLSSLVATIGTAYRTAGADFITIHEMGGSPGFIGPAKFEQFVLPALTDLNRKLAHPTVVSVCGNTNSSMPLLAQTGADAISVDQTNNLAASRSLLRETLLFGNLDPVQTLWQGDEGSIMEAARLARESGVDALWPGCDLVPQSSMANIRAFVKSFPT